MKSPVPLLNPDDIIRQFSRIDGALRQAYVEGSRRLLVDRIERASQLVRFPIPPHRKTFHDFFFLTNGSLTRSKGIDNYTVSAGDFFVMPAYQITTNDYSSPDIQGFFCAFSNDIFSSTLADANLLTHFPFFSADAQPVIRIPLAEQPFVVSLLEKLLREHQNQQPDKHELMASCLLTLFREMNRAAKMASAPLWPDRPGAATAAERITQQFKRDVEQYGQRILPVTAYAERLSVSPNHLNKAVRNVTGRTATAWIIDRLILEAKVLLAQTDLPIADIAQVLGLTDVSYFGRFFRKITGQSPSDYRKWIDLSE